MHIYIANLDCTYLRVSHSLHSLANYLIITLSEGLAVGYYLTLIAGVVLRELIEMYCHIPVITSSSQQVKQSYFNCFSVNRKNCSVFKLHIDVDERPKIPTM